MPQIDQLDAFTTSQIFWVLIFFGITFFVIGRGMVPKVMSTVALRDEQISSDLTAAQAARDAAAVALLQSAVADICLHRSSIILKALLVSPV